jgi:hypothetical protein
MAITRHKSTAPHMEWLDLRGDGTLDECAIMKEDSTGIYHIPLSNIDEIDKGRLVNIIMNRNSQHFPLWELMQQTTLGNGVNALTYFHQLVKVLTPSGQIIDPMPGRRGAEVGTGSKRKS